MKLDWIRERPLHLGSDHWHWNLEMTLTTKEEVETYWFCLRQSDINNCTLARKFKGYLPGSIWQDFGNWFQRWVYICFLTEKPRWITVFTCVCHNWWKLWITRRHWYSYYSGEFFTSNNLKKAKEGIGSLWQTKFVSVVATLDIKKFVFFPPRIRLVFISLASLFSYICAQHLISQATEKWPNFGLTMCFDSFNLHPTIMYSRLREHVVVDIVIFFLDIP